MTIQNLLLSTQMRAAEAAAIAAGTPGFVLMERAAEAVADAARAMAPGGMPVLVLCGPGNNGGDGYLTAVALAASGYAVDLARLGPVPERGDAARAAALWSGPVGDAARCPIPQGALVIDALFGLGLTRDLDPTARDLVDRVNASGARVLAVDIPSGIDADTGAVRGAAIRATRTVTFAARKPGHLLYPGRAHCGEVDVAEIGVTASADGSPVSSLNTPALWRDRLVRPSLEGNKFDRGHALVVSGGPGHTGAARMAARGALRAGAGLVSLVTSARALGINASHLTAIMLQVCDEPDAFSDLLADERLNAVLIGPGFGIGETTRDWVRAALEADRATLLDADALTSFKGAADDLAGLIDADRTNPVVVTPHGGEFARLFAGDAPELVALREHPSKVERARMAARHLGAVVVLKGADTVIAAPDGRAAINTNGSPHLATAGSGDVLGGIVLGLMAQHVPGFEAACAGVWMHAAAGTRFGPGLIAEDLPDILPVILAELTA